MKRLIVIVLVLMASVACDKKPEVCTIQYFDTLRDILFIESPTPVEGCGVPFYEPPHPWKYNKSCIVRATVYTSNRDFIEEMRFDPDLYIQRNVCK